MVSRPHSLAFSDRRLYFKPFLVSPRNSVPAITNLIEKTSCHRIITQPSFHPLLDAVREVLSPDTGYALRVDNIPDVYAIFPTSKGGQDSPVSPFPPPSKQPTVDDIVLILHSSGSTGLPKPVPQKHINVLEWSRSGTSSLPSFRRPSYVEIRCSGNHESR